MNKYACKFHPKGLCGGIYTEEKKIGCVGYDSGQMRVLEAEVCPWPSRQSDPPKMRTKLDVACDVYRNDPLGTGSVNKLAMKSVLVTVGVNPDDVMEE